MVRHGGSGAREQKSQLSKHLKKAKAWRGQQPIEVWDGTCPEAKFQLRNLDSLLGDISRGARLPAEATETRPGSCSPAISSAPVGVIQGPQPPAEPAWAECRLAVPTSCGGAPSVRGSGDGQELWNTGHYVLSLHNS